MISWRDHVHGAFTGLYSAFHLGTRGIETMKQAGILPFFTGIAVSDRYPGLLERDLDGFRRVPGPKTTVKQEPRRELLEFCRDRRVDVLRFAADTTIWPTNNLSDRGVRPPKTQQKISGRLASDDVTQDRLDIRGYIDTARKHGLNALDVLHQLMPGNRWLPQGLGIVALCPFYSCWVGRGLGGPGGVPGVVRAGGCDAGVPGRFGGSRWRADRGCGAIWLWPSGRFRRIL